MNTANTLLAIFGAACTGLITVTTWGFLTGKFKTTTEMSASRLLEELREHKEETKRRFEQAGKETSDAWTYVQGIESKMLREFAPRDLTDERFRENRHEHELIRGEIDRLRTR